jgi:aldehyde dehydrogenase (NAD+)
MSPLLDSVKPPALWINGRPFRHSSGGVGEHIYAADGCQTCSFPFAGKAEIDAAVLAADAAHRRWRSRPTTERAETLAGLAAAIERHGAELARLQSTETGMPIGVASRLPAIAARFFAWHASEGHQLLNNFPARNAGLGRTEVAPFGVIAAIIPWNSSLTAAAQITAAALLCGNAVILKPSPLAPFTTFCLAELAASAGMPSGLINVVQGDAAVGERLVAHPGVAKVFFIGSQKTARKVVATSAEALKPLCLELGGNAAVIVLSDADLLAAAHVTLSGWIGMSGQACALPTRVLVQADIADRFVTILKGLARRARIGDPLDVATQMGPLVSAAARDRCLAIIDEARHGAADEVWSVRLPQGLPGGGFYVAPHILSELARDSSLREIEVFAPVLIVERFEQVSAAIEAVNDSPFGLAAYVFSSDRDRVLALARALDVGTVACNMLPEPDPAAPFGGWRQSGFGRLGGEAGLLEFLQLRHIALAEGT